MSDQPSWRPSDEEIAEAINEYMKRLARKYMGGMLPGGVVDDLRDNPVVALIDSAVEKALAEQRQQFMEPPLAREQPCGCVVCTCDGDEDRCYGCGAKNCDDPTTCVLRLGDRTKRVYRDAPSYSGLLAKLAKQEARHKREVLEARIESLEAIVQAHVVTMKDAVDGASRRAVSEVDIMAYVVRLQTIRAELAALDNPKNAADAAMPEEET